MGDKEVISNEDLRRKLNYMNGTCFNMKALGALANVSQQHMSGFILGKRNMSENVRARIESAISEIVKGLVG